jgi:azurin
MRVHADMIIKFLNQRQAQSAKGPKLGALTSPFRKSGLPKHRLTAPLMIRPLFALLFAAAARAVDPAVFTLKTMTAQMKYDTTEMLVQPGQPVKILFENGDDLPHNLVFCQPGTDTAAMAMKQMEKPEEALKRNWLPDDPRIWAHSKMLNPHEKEEICLHRTRKKPGAYPYVCTFPGHALTMRGELKVAPAGEGLQRPPIRPLPRQAGSNCPDFAKLKPHREGKVDDNLIAGEARRLQERVRRRLHRQAQRAQEGLLPLLPRQRRRRAHPHRRQGSRRIRRHPSRRRHQGERASHWKRAHEFRLEYFQGGGDIDLYAAWKGADFQITPLSKWLHPELEGRREKEKEFAPIPLVVTDEPVIYRNFIQGAGNRGIGVGYPGGINLAWSAESMNLALVWRGAFIDAARHWNSRGGGHEKPLGYDVLQPTGEVTPAFHVTDKPDAAWPKWDKAKRYEGFKWKGYTLDAKRFPTFRYTWQEAEIEEPSPPKATATSPMGTPNSSAP